MEHHPWLPKWGPTDPAVCCSENEALWREVASLRQKHAQQQKVVNKVGTTGSRWVPSTVARGDCVLFAPQLIQFLISLVQSNRILGVKRKM